MATNAQGDWLCPDCTAGKPVPPRAACCSRERFLQQQGLGLGRIEGLWEDADGEEQCMLRWFEVPDNTHIGRQVSHLSTMLPCRWYAGQGTTTPRHWLLHCPT